MQNILPAEIARAVIAIADFISDGKLLAALRDQLVATLAAEERLFGLETRAVEIARQQGDFAQEMAAREEKLEQERKELLPAIDALAKERADLQSLMEAHNKRVVAFEQAGGTR